MRPGGWRRWGSRVVASAALICAGLSGPPPAAHAATPAVLSRSSFHVVWSHGPFSDDRLEPIAESSPMVATLDRDGPSVVVGDRTGYVYAYHLSDGTAVQGWPISDGGAPVDSTPSTTPSGPGGLDELFIGTGNAGQPYEGGYRAFAADGRQVWATDVVDPPSDYAPATGVQASMTVAVTQGHQGVFAGSLGQEAYALGTSNGHPLAGWPFFSADSTFSTAAAADLYGTGQTELVVGGASTAGLALGQTYPQGGHLRILNDRGGLICHYDLTQEVDSSPAVGGFLRGGSIGIAVGTGTYYHGVSDADAVYGFDTHCDKVWSVRLDGATESSPALSDVFGTGTLDVVEGTDNGSVGSVYVLSGSTGGILRRYAVSGQVIGSVVTADLTGRGYQDLLVPTPGGVDVIDPTTGTEFTLPVPGGYQNSPLVTDDPNGEIGVTVAGYQGNNEGIIYHLEIPGSNGAEAVGRGSWPMFHHDPRLSGVAPEVPLSRTAGCQVPEAARPGYNLVATDGGVFSFQSEYCGSTGGVRLARPVVAAAMAPASGGYWLVASDGGVFSFGGARYYGSAARLRLSKPVVGMAATPDGRGYWLVAADGGVFPFGDAHFYGSAGSRPLSSPVVGMAATADGAGYWLVAADGTVYRYGDAPYQGSAGELRLAHPIVGMAEDRATGGYWLVASDGGVFSYGDPFFGSTGSLRLTRPVTGITGTGDGRGYWMVASDGGVFSFGDAPFAGSTGRVRLTRPVIALVGFSS